ncbi:MAG: Lipase chaperone [Syntrophus sp. SKADARSKE-3]|nr:Lipase chaperone [Syntrophus sp. SKADARSKE-3]
MIRKNKIVLTFVCIVIVIFSCYMLHKYFFNEAHCLINNPDIKFADVLAVVHDEPLDESSLKELFSQGVLNKNTLRFFNIIETRFLNHNFESEDQYFAAVKIYLSLFFSEKQASEFLEFYKNYMQYIRELESRRKSWMEYPPETMEQNLKYIEKLQEFRRQYFGKETADLLFGVEVKGMEYPLRRELIIRNHNLYGQEKEKLLNELNTAAWGEEAPRAEDIKLDLQKYRVKLDIYKRDLDEMTEEQKIAKIREIRQEYFDMDTIVRLETLDAWEKDKKRKETEYYSARQMIQDSYNISDEEKIKKIDELRKNIFGVDAEKMKIKDHLQNGLIRKN